MNRMIFITVLIAFLLVACTSASTPEKAVETYFESISEKDASRLSTITCKDWEADALMMLDSFNAVSTSLESLSCRQTDTGANGNIIVSCDGKLVASYNGELQEFDLSAQEYIVENSTGEWLVCGTN
jgi:outer membrane lipoprotein-sorting protein